MAERDSAQAMNEPRSCGKVLLVDDEPELRRVLRRALVRSGFEVVEASNGRAAVALARGGEFEVVVSDVRMPEMGGLELLDQLRLEAPALPVVLMSGSNRLEDAEAARQSGAFDFLDKPIQLQNLRASTSRAVEAYREHVLAEDLELRESGVRVVAPNWLATIAGSR